MESRNSSGYGGGFSRLFSSSSESRSSYRPKPSYSSESAVEREVTISSSESRQTSVSSESRGTSYEDWLKTDPGIARGGLSSDGEMHQAYQEGLKEQGCTMPKKKAANSSDVPQEKRYNSLDDIDKLIERLEASMSGINVTSERANQVLNQRQQKIDELKKSVAEARKAEEEERVIQQLEQENSELDDAIDILNKGFHR